MTGLGTVSTPWDLATALTNNLVRAGDTVYLRGGTYTGAFTCALNGTAERLITFRAYPGERPIIDGTLALSGSYQRWQGIEVYQSAFTNRESIQSSTDPTDIGGAICVDITGNYIEFINGCVHDGRRGFGVSGAALGTLIYGNLIFFNGWKNPANFYGHGIYPQNAAGVKKRIINNMLFDGFGFGIHAYTGGGGALDDFYVEGNTLFDHGVLADAAQRSTNLLIGGSEPFGNPEVYENYAYMSINAGRNLQVGYGVGNTVTNAKVQNNYAAGAGALYLVTCVPTALTGNSLYGATEGFVQDDYPTNTYGAVGAWGDVAYLRSNAYDSNRANLTIYNVSQAATVSVNVVSVFVAGSTVKAHNVQNYFVDIQTLTVADDGTITVNMEAANRTVATPVGWTAPATTFPQFGAFVLEKVTS